ncbi:AP-1 complex subunit sigma-2 [Diplodia seriata]|uniref:AP-1 complex subunit sigma-1 n=1 Tax=Diplodia seriata TaxID=420778 RepID=A0A1S8BK89_9PEZI|nr:AP-1 complex subunit sigma-2 [Diplodia seriata]
MCNFLEYKDTKIVYRRYASLFFIAGCDSEDNELITLEVVHRYVEQMDKYYGNVCELDIIFNFQKAYFILDELLLAGEMQESSKKNVLRCISQQDSLEDMEVSRQSLSASRRRRAPSAAGVKAVSGVIKMRFPNAPSLGGVNESFRSRTTASPRLVKPSVAYDCNLL